MSFFKNKNKAEKKEIKSKSGNKDEKKKPTKVKKLLKLKSDVGIKTIRIVTWSVIGIICLRGVIAFIKPDPVKSIQRNNDEFKAELSKDNQIESRAFSFAESFTREYFTLYSGEKEDYQKRLSKYIQNSKTENIDVKGYTSVESVQAYDVQKYSKDQLDVYVYAKVQVRTEKSGQEGIIDPNLKQYDTYLKDIYMKVPIYYTDKGEMVAENLPVIIGAPKLATQKVNTDSIGVGSASSTAANEIKDSLNQFFKAYYKEDQTQVDYFLEKPGAITAVGGGATFKEIEKNTVYDMGNGEFKAVVEFKVDMAGKIVKQGVNVTLKYKDDKYLVRNIDSRLTNFN